MSVNKNPLLESGAAQSRTAMKKSRKISPPAKATTSESPGGNLQNLKAKPKAVSAKQASDRARKEATNTKPRMQPIHEAPAISKRSKSK